jgi:predicted Zn-dependent protease with MMP-like domain
MVVVPAERFDELVVEALDALPDWILERMDNVEVTVEEHPPADQPNLLGHYHGIPLSNRGMGYAGVLPDRITLYRSTLQASSRDADDLRHRVSRTVAHEIAHHFGISDDRLHEIDAY